VSLYKRLYEAQDAAKPITSRAPDAGDLRRTIHHQLIEELGPVLFDRKLEPEELRRRITDAIQAAIARERTPLSASDRAKMVDDLTDDIIGYGAIDRFLKDDEVTDIMVNGPDSVYIEREGKLVKTDVTFTDEEHLRRIIDKIVSEIGRRVDQSSPLCDARLPDGSRVNAVVEPVALNGPFLTVRKFSAERLKVDDLIRFKTLDAPVARFLQACILGRLNVVVSGGSGTGKTTTLNVLSGFVPASERIITIEDAKELQLHQDHLLCLESRPPNIDGAGEITIRDLVKNSLRMRPDRIIVGEVRGGESLDMLQAMNTGHDGSITTVHANGARDALSRIETLVLMAGYDLPIRAIREQMASALDLIVHMSRLRDGTRRITEISEVQGMEGDAITLLDLFRFDYSAGIDPHGKFLGTLQPTGVRPKFAEKLGDLGIQMPAELFAVAEDDELAAGQRPLPAGEPVVAGAAPVDHEVNGVRLFADDAEASG
jgi:pilus assembly protein CpaF